jgi:Zn-dependent protease
MANSLGALLVQNPLLFVLVAAALILSLTFHEFAHAYVANKLGDGTARMLGRLTLNPLAHLDPLGTLMLLFAGFGWGKPVPFDPYQLKNPKRDAALISLAGPMSNFILALCFALALHLIDVFLSPATGTSLQIPALVLSKFFYLVILYNLVLGFFNLIPINPLDGFKIVNGMLPPRLSVQWIQLAPYGIFFLMFLIITGMTSQILNPLISISLRLLGL